MNEPLIIHAQASAGAAQEADGDDDALAVRTAAAGWSAGQIRGARGEQQDSYAWLLESADEPNADASLLLLVADGMGGHSAGGLASRTVAHAFVDAFRDSAGAISERLEDAVEQANEAVGSASMDEGALRMGTTLLAAHIAGRRLRWVSVGDSPMWLLAAATRRGEAASGRLKRLNQDHSMKPVLAQLLETGQLTEAEVAHDGRRNELRSAITGDEIRLMDFQEQPVQLHDDDVLLLATDGLETLSRDEIATLLATGNQSTATIVELLLTAVRQHAGKSQDNATVIAYAAPTRSQPSPRSPSLWLPLVAIAALLLFVAVMFLYGRTPDPDVASLPAGGTPAQPAEAPGEMQ